MWFRFSGAAAPRASGGSSFILHAYSDPASYLLSWIALGQNAGARVGEILGVPDALPPYDTRRRPLGEGRTALRGNRVGRVNSDPLASGRR